MPIDTHHYYAIADGKLRGIMHGWVSAQRYVEDYPGCFFMGFPSFDQANRWMLKQRGRFFNYGVNWAGVRTTSGFFIGPNILEVKTWACDSRVGGRPADIYIFENKEDAVDAVNDYDIDERRVCFDYLIATNHEQESLETAVDNSGEAAAVGIETPDTGVDGDIYHWYAIADGRFRGVVLGWLRARKYIEGYPGAFFRTFQTPEAADNWLNLQRGRRFREGVYSILILSCFGCFAVERLMQVNSIVRKNRPGRESERWNGHDFYVYETVQKARNALENVRANDRRIHFLSPSCDPVSDHMQNSHINPPFYGTTNTAATGSNALQSIKSTTFALFGIDIEGVHQHVADYIDFEYIGNSETNLFCVAYLSQEFSLVDQPTDVPINTSRLFADYSDLLSRNATNPRSLSFLQFERLVRHGFRNLCRNT